MCCKNEKSLQINNCWTWLPCVLVYMWSPPAFHPHKSQPRIDIFWNILLIYKLQEFNPEYFWQNVFTMSSVDCAWNYAFWHLYLVSFLLLQYSRLREGQFFLTYHVLEGINCWRREHFLSHDIQDWVGVGAHVFRPLIVSDMCFLQAAAGRQ